LRRLKKINEIRENPLNPPNPRSIPNDLILMITFYLKNRFADRKIVVSRKDEIAGFSISAHP
jgi:hypothetical protein